LSQACRNAVESNKDLVVRIGQVETIAAILKTSVDAYLKTIVELREQLAPVVLLVGALQDKVKVLGDPSDESSPGLLWKVHRLERRVVTNQKMIEERVLAYFTSDDSEGPAPNLPARVHRLEDMTERIDDDLDTLLVHLAAGKDDDPIINSDNLDSPEPTTTESSPKEKEGHDFPVTPTGFAGGIKG
jgi:hypothetical protein